MTFKPKCGKLVYVSRALAKRALKLFNKVKESGKWAKKLTNVYYCEACSGYHLTSMSKRRSRKITRKQ